ncbi:MAG: hypothetical protein U5J62_01355 [Desulfurivibrio sp.]|nr:hypothetical protein [Desulfurivibrio sp.]
MECSRFQRLIKEWYLQVQDEAMAPARMVAFMEKHLAECPVCLQDSGVREEVEKIITMLLPAAKLQTPADSDGDDDEITDDSGVEEAESGDDDEIPEEFDEEDVD